MLPRFVNFFAPVAPVVGVVVGILLDRGGVVSEDAAGD